jgi:hypothetical protein
LLENITSTLLALKQPRSVTILSLYRFFIDPAYRAWLASRVADPAARAFLHLYDHEWDKRFREEASAPLMTKANKFASSPLLRAVLGQPRSSFDFRQVLDTRQILLCDLSKGLLGSDVASLVGSLVVTKLALAALSRQDTPEGERVPHYLYADEVQNFVYGMDLPTILSEARKYRLTLIVATQTIAQLPHDTQAALFGNCGTITSFRVSGVDAEILEQEFAGPLPARALQNLDDYELYLRTLSSGSPVGPFLLRTFPPRPKSGQESTPDRIIDASLRRYGRPREGVEAKLRGNLAVRHQRPPSRDRR